MTDRLKDTYGSLVLGYKPGDVLQLQTSDGMIFVDFGTHKSSSRVRVVAPRKVIITRSNATEGHDDGSRT